mmetsp:Transcript_58566/g.156780  ORF Transcript_58566/g.156780 Transcript_58566/m.156780 type:complete len:299 (-) Transcript_58566:666-1562(-)
MPRASHHGKPMLQVPVGVRLLQRCQSASRPSGLVADGLLPGMHLAPPVQDHVSLGATDDPMPPTEGQVQHVASGQLHPNRLCMAVVGAASLEVRRHAAWRHERRHNGVGVAWRLCRVEAVNIRWVVELKGLRAGHDQQQVLGRVEMHGCGIPRTTKVCVDALRVGPEALPVLGDRGGGRLFYVLDELWQLLAEGHLPHVECWRPLAPLCLFHHVKVFRKGHLHRGVRDKDLPPIAVLHEISLHLHGLPPAAPPQVVKVCKVVERGELFLADGARDHHWSVQQHMLQQLLRRGALKPRH